MDPATAAQDSLTEVAKERVVISSTTKLASLNGLTPKKGDGLRKWVLIKKAQEKLDLSEGIAHFNSVATTSLAGLLTHDAVGPLLDSLWPTLMPQAAVTTADPGAFPPSHHVGGSVAGISIPGTCSGGFVPASALLTAGGSSGVPSAESPPQHSNFVSPPSVCLGTLGMGRVSLTPALVVADGGANTAAGTASTDANAAAGRLQLVAAAHGEARAHHHHGQAHLHHKGAAETAGSGSGSLCFHPPPPQQYVGSDLGTPVPSVCGSVSSVGNGDASLPGGMAMACPGLRLYAPAAAATHGHNAGHYWGVRQLSPTKCINPRKLLAGCDSAAAAAQTHSPPLSPTKTRGIAHLPPTSPRIPSPLKRRPVAVSHADRMAMDGDTVMRIDSLEEGCGSTLAVRLGLIDGDFKECISCDDLIDMLPMDIDFSLGMQSGSWCSFTDRGHGSKRFGDGILMVEPIVGLKRHRADEDVAHVGGIGGVITT